MELSSRSPLDESVEIASQAIYLTVGGRAKSHLMRLWRRS
jgi:hypothetical protein